MDPTGPKLAGISRQSRIATERRHSVRHRAHTPAYATLNESQDGAPDLSEILDISEDGMSIQTSAPLEVERDVSLCLDLSETRTRIRTAGQVIWSDTAGRAGIRFAQMSGQSLDQLQEWLFVNVLTAVDHAQTAPPDTGVWNSTSNGLLASHSMAKDELASETPPISGHGSVSRVKEATPRADAMQADAARGITTENATERDSAVEPNGFDRETTLQLIAERALSLTRATGAAIALSEGNDSEMICAASAGSDSPPRGARLQIGSGFSGECVRTGRSLRCDDSELDDRVDREGCRALGIRSMVAVPIRPGGKVAGLLEVFSPQPYAFNADDIGALQQLTGTISSTIAPAPAVPAPPAPVQTAPAPSPTVQKAVTARTAPARIENRPAAEVATATPARPVAPVKPSNRRSLHKILLVAALGTFGFAVLWLIAPWISSTLGSSGRAASRARPAQAAVPKPPNSTANVTDLASLRKVAEKGDPTAQFQLGVHYATGEEVKQDYAEAVRWFTLAADQGHILAQATLGAYYWAGRGVPQDLTKAYYWSVLAQAGGDQASKYRVAVLTSRMSRGQIVAARQQADDWLRNFAGHAPTSP